MTEKPLVLKVMFLWCLSTGGFICVWSLGVLASWKGTLFPFMNNLLILKCSLVNVRFSRHLSGGIHLCLVKTTVNVVTFFQLHFNPFIKEKCWLISKYFNISVLHVNTLNPNPKNWKRKLSFQRKRLRFYFCPKLPNATSLSCRPSFSHSLIAQPLLTPF